jgi:hypothetical protein
MAACAHRIEDSFAIVGDMAGELQAVVGVQSGPSRYAMLANGSPLVGRIFGVNVTLADSESSWCRNQQKETNRDRQT